MSVRLKRFGDLEMDGQTIKGTWELTPDHEVVYRAEGRAEEIRFKAPLIAAEPDALVVALTVNQDDQTVVTRTARITGRWKTDGKNRIVFEIERAGGRRDEVVFAGTWKLNDAQEIVYTYRTRAIAAASRSARAGGERRVREQEIIFRGYWELADRRRLTYVLGADSESAFRFRGTLQSPSILAKKGEIRFQLGAEAAGRAARAGRKGSRMITLFGVWKVSRDLALSFELDQPGSHRSVLRFGGQFELKNGRTLSVRLRSERGTPLGVELVLSREILGGDGELFARLTRTAQETLAEAGGRMRF